MRTVTITCLLQFDVNGKASNENILKTLKFINESLQQANLDSQPQILAERSTDYLLNEIKQLED